MSEIIIPKAGSVATLRSLGREEYHASKDRVSQSMLKDFIKSPEIYKGKYIDNPPTINFAETDAMRHGKDVEEFIYTQKLPRNPVKIPQHALHADGSRKNNKGQTNYSGWLESINWRGEDDDRLLLKPSEWDAFVGPLFHSHKQVMLHKQANRLLYKFPNERSVVIFSQYQEDGLDIPTRAELDLVSSKNFIVDVKTSDCSSRSAFAKKIWNYGYHIQGWWYRHIYKQLTGETLPYLFIVIKNKPPYNVETYYLDDDFLDLAETTIRRSMIALNAAMVTNNWHTSSWGNVAPIGPVGWMKKQEWSENE